ncbi:MAG: STAS domain-containing protein [candidate division Zixibacteria bacterium]|nr:STAS domain-containing protein [candidate division Zixibacteria bacterium]MDD5426692.1 STAS domain-containing protein [candidate division Zixibacteria bacterium]
MKFKDHLEGDIAVFEISGRIMGGEETTLFHGRIREYINFNKIKIIIDLAKVEWINSVGIGILISTLTTVTNAKGRLALVNIKKIENLLSVTRLITVFEHFDSRDAAIKDFSK